MVQSGITFVNLIFYQFLAHEYKKEHYAFTTLFIALIAKDDEDSN